MIFFSSLGEIIQYKIIEYRKLNKSYTTLCAPANQIANENVTEKQ